MLFATGTISHCFSEFLYFFISRLRSILISLKVFTIVLESILVTPSAYPLKMSAFKRTFIFSWLATVNQVLVYVQKVTMIL